MFWGDDDKPKRKSIPKAVKDTVWSKYIRAKKIKRKLKAIGSIALAFIVLAVYVFAVIKLISFTRDEDTNTSSILDYGQRVVGMITDKKVWHDSEGDSHQIFYTFNSSSGQNISGNYTYNNTTNLQIGDKIQIAYDIRSPANNIPVNNNGSREGAAWFASIILFIPVGFLIFWLLAQAWGAW